MKVAKIFLMGFLAVFLMVVTVFAQVNTTPVDPGPVVPPAPGPVPPAPIPEPSILVLLGMGLAAGGAYSFFRRQKSRDRE